MLCRFVSHLLTLLAGLFFISVAFAATGSHVKRQAGSLPETINIGVLIPKTGQLGSLGAQAGSGIRKGLEDASEGQSVSLRWILTRVIQNMMRYDSAS